MMKRQALWKSVLCAFMALVIPTNPILAQAVPVQFRPSVQVNVPGPMGLQVNSYSGNLYYSRTDLVIPGRGLDLVISLAYNSGQALDDGPVGYGWNFSYNIYYEKDGSDVHIYRGDGRVDKYVWSGGAFVQPLGVRDTLEEYAPDQYRLKSPDGVETFFDSSTHKHVTSIQEPNGNALTFGYSGSQLMTITDTVGRQFDLTFDANRLRTITDPNTSPSRTMLLQYDGSGNLISISDLGENTTHYDYSAHGHLLTGVTDPLGNEATIAYTLAPSGPGKFVASNISTAETSKSFDYDKLGRATTVSDVVDGETRTSRYMYDAFGRIESIENGMGHVVSMAWDDRNNLSSLTDEHGHTTYYAYDASDNPLSVTDPLSNTTFYTYEPTYNQVTSITDANDYSTIFEYDAQGNLITITDALGQQTLFDYDVNGDLIGMTDANANTTNYGYNGHGDLDTVTDPLGHAVYEYDEVGNMLTATDPNGNTTTFAHDALGRLITVTNALNQQATSVYDANGNVLGVTDAHGNTTHYAYDALDRLIAVTDALDSQTSYTYDQAHNLRTIVNAEGYTTTFEYDAANRFIAETDAVGNVTTYEYDEAGNLVGRTDANGAHTTYDYDAAGRLLGVDYPGADQDETYDYDAVGNQTLARNPNVTTEYTFNALNQVESVHDVSHAWDKTTDYTYDAVGNRATMSDHEFGTTTYEYDAANRLITLVNPLGQTTGYTFDDGGRQTRKDLDNGTHADYEYDRAGNVLTMTNRTSADAVISSYAYEYDNVGNRTQVTDAAGDVTAYDYDNVYRLLTVIYPDGSSQDYDYDAVGNRLAMVDSISGTINYTYDDADRLLSAGTTDYDWDHNGNQTGKVEGGKGTVYAYDYQNRLTEITFPDGNVNAFSYYPDGRRLSATDKAGTTTYYIYDGDNLLLETDDGGGVVARYTSGLSVDAWISMDREGATSYYHQDDLNSVTGLTDDGETVVATYAYDVFGNMTSETGSIVNPLRYTGRELDAESGLYYYRARYYDTRVGRFFTEDLFPGSVANPLSLNKYPYVQNNPANFLDPYGTFVLPVIVVAIIFILVFVIVVQAKQLNETNAESPESSYVGSGQGGRDGPGGNVGDISQNNIPDNALPSQLPGGSSACWPGPDDRPPWWPWPLPWPPWPWPWPWPHPPWPLPWPDPWPGDFSIKIDNLDNFIETQGNTGGDYGSGGGGAGPIWQPYVLSKTVDDDTPAPGQQIAYTIIVENRGSNAATNAVISDTLPAGLTFAGPVVLVGSDGTVAQSGDDLPTLASGLTISAGESVIVTLPVTVDGDLPSGAVMYNTASVASTEVPTPETDSQVIVLLWPELVLSKTATPVNPPVGTLLEYEIVVGNLGNQDAVDVVISDTLDSRLTPAGPIVQQGGGGEVTYENGSFLASGLSITQGESIIFSLPVTLGLGASDGMEILNTAVVTLPGSTVLTGTALIVARAPILDITKNVNDIAPAPGETITFSIVVENGGMAAATNAVISDMLPAGLIFAGPVVLQGSDGTVAQSAADLPALASGLTISAGERITVTLPVTVDGDLAVGTLITNTAFVASTEIVTPQANAQIIVIEPAGGSLEVSIVDPVGDPIPAHVILKDAWGNEMGWQDSLPGDPARFWGLEPGEYMVQAWPTEADIPTLANSEPMWLFVQESMTIILELLAPNVIGSIQTPEGDPLPPAHDEWGDPAHPAEVNLHNADWSIDVWAMTNMAGEFSLALPSDHYVLGGHPVGSLNISYTKSVPVEFWTPEPGDPPLDLGSIPLTFPCIMGWVATPDGDRVSARVDLWNEDRSYGDWDETLWYPPEVEKPFRFGGLQPGHYFVQSGSPYDDPGAFGSSNVYDFFVPDDCGQEITLSLDATNFIGHLLLPPDSDCPDCPVPGAEVKLRNESGTFVDWTNTDENGRFAFSGLEPDVYVVNAFVPEQFAFEWDPPPPEHFTLPAPNPPVERVMVLQHAVRNKHVVGVVLYDDTGDPVGDVDGDGEGDALVYAYHDEAGQGTGQPNLPDGSFGLDLKGGLWWVGVEPMHSGVDWYFDPDWEQPVDFPHDPTLELTEWLTLTVARAEFFHVTGVVATPDGAPIVPGTVGVDLCDDQGHCFGGPVEPNGDFVLRALPGIYDLWIHVDPGTNLLPPLDNGFPVFIDQDVDLGAFWLRASGDRSASVSGRVIISPTGEGLPGVMMEAWTDTGDWNETESGAGGNYVLNLFPGHWVGGPGLSEEQQEQYVVLPPRHREGHLEAGETISNVNFYVVRRDATIQGHVVDISTTLVISDIGAFVYAEHCPPDDTLPCRIVAETEVREGAFELGVVGNHTYNLGIWIASGGYMAGPPVEVFVDRDQTAQADVAVIAARTRIHGYLLDPDGARVHLLAFVYGVEPAEGYWVEDSLWPEKEPYEYELWVPTPASETVTWTMWLGVSPHTGYTPDPAHPEYQIVVPPGETNILQIMYVRPLETQVAGRVLLFDGTSLVPAPYVWVFAEGKEGTDSQGLYFETETDENGDFAMYVLPGEYVVNAYLPPHLADDFIPPLPQEWNSMGDNPVIIKFRPRPTGAGALNISGSLTVSPTGALDTDAPILVLGWSPEAGYSEVTGTLSGGYRLPVISNTTWYVWAVYEDPDNNVFYSSVERMVDVGTVGVPGTDLMLGLADVALPDAICESFDPLVFKRISLPTWPGTPESLIDIQAGTMPVSGTVQICATPILGVPRGHDLVGFAYEMEARDSLGELISADFKKPVRIMFYFNADMLGDADPTELEPGFYSTARQEWVSLDDVFIDPDDWFATGKINHFTYMGILSAAPEAASDSYLYLPIILKGFGG